MVGCQKGEEVAELEAMKAQTGVEEQNKALVKRMYEVWEKGDFEAYKEVVAPEYARFKLSQAEYIKLENLC